MAADETAAPCAHRSATGRRARVVSVLGLAALLVGFASDQRAQSAAPLRPVRTKTPSSGRRPGLAPVSLSAQTAPHVSPSPPRGGSWHPGSYRLGPAYPVLVGSRLANGSPAYVAWIGHARTRLALYPGLREPAGASPRGLAEVPNGQRWRLLATFNGGFKSNAGGGGFVVNGHVYEPLQAGFGTLVEYRDGALAILKWRRSISPGSLVLARQNLTPLVWASRPSARARDSRLWGATLGGGPSVWRSALGITRAGDLLYAAAGGQTPLSLAALLVRIGAVRAIELDINPEWPSFIGYRKRAGRDPLKLVPNPQQSAYRYLSPDTRDFFAVYTRAGGGPFVPLH